MSLSKRAPRAGRAGDGRRDQEVAQADSGRLAREPTRARATARCAKAPQGRRVAGEEPGEAPLPPRRRTFSEARRDEQRALEQLAKGAREIAESAGIGSSALGKATETLRAASLTAEGRELLRRGRLTEELEPPGFEALTGLEGLGRQATSARPEPKPRRSNDQAEKRRSLKLARERLRQLRVKERELATAARAAAREAERAEAEAGAARSRATDAQEKARAMSDQREAAEADARPARVVDAGCSGGGGIRTHERLLRR